MDLYDQVDFCPFRGPDAPFARGQSYHREPGVSHAGRFEQLLSNCSGQRVVVLFDWNEDVLTGDPSARW
jgi:hypothetical protein